MIKRKDLQIISEIIPSKSRVLDLGCGNGQLLQELAKEKNVKGLGIEISLERVKSCLKQGISVVQEDLNDGLKDFHDKSFNYIILSQTLEHISNPAFLIQEMLRVGEKCIISFDNLAYWKNRVIFLFRGLLKESNIDDNAFNNYNKKQILTVKKFLKFCESYKFKICKNIFLPKKFVNFNKIFPNLLSKTAIFFLKEKKDDY